MSRPPDVPRGAVGLPPAVAGLVAVAALLSTEDRQLLIRALAEQVVEEMSGGLTRAGKLASQAQPPRSRRSRYHAPEADR